MLNRYHFFYFIFFSRPVACPTRLNVGIMMFAAAFASYLLRVNMSINILGMVQPSNSTNDTSDVRLFLICTDMPSVSIMFLPISLSLSVCVCRCLVWTAIRLGCKWTEHDSGSVLLRIHVDTNTRRHSGRLDWWTTGDRYCAGPECGSYNADPVRGESFVLGCFHYALWHWHIWRWYFPSNTKSYCEMGAAQREREIRFDNGRWHSRHGSHLAGGRLADGQLRMGVCIPRAGLGHDIADCRLVLHRL